VLVPDRLVELSIFVGHGDLEAVVTALMRERALHVDARESEHWAPEPTWAELSESYRALAARLTAVQHALGLDDAPPAADLQPRPSQDRLALESALLRLETKVGGWQADDEAVRRERVELEAARRQLELLRPLDAPVEDLRRLHHHHLTIGTLPTDNVARVAAALFQVAFVLVPLERLGERSLVAVATAREDGHVLDRALKSAFFEPVELPHGVAGLPPAALARVGDELAALRVRADEADRRRRALADEVAEDLRAALARARLDLEVCEALRRFPSRDGVTVVSGWVPARRLAAVEAQVRAAAAGPLVVESLPPAGGRRDVPSLVRNPPWLRPFAVLVDTYGLAGYDELNPTLVAAVVFLFMYGMMFGDLGHGLLLAGIGLLLRRITPFGTVVAAAGVAATLFGALYGVAFGAKVMEPLWLQPLHAIFPLLIASVAAGAVILNLGFALNLVSAWRIRDWPRFWLDKSGVLGVALYWALLGGGVAALSGRLPVVAWLLAVAPLAAATWLREPLAERLQGRRPRWADHLLTGFFELFEAVIAYLSNSLSFVRLGAFAVAHEGLSGMVLRYATGSTGWVTFLLGTALIVGFEGLIVGIQAMRLQYYEFFGRFFQGRGQPFRPLSFAGGTDAPPPLRT
jgi:V/A-type H+/Na+-transporting ATPase subunit I